jgi:hypothetical protein
VHGTRHCSDFEFPESQMVENASTAGFPAR